MDESKISILPRMAPHKVTKCEILFVEGTKRAIRTARLEVASAVQDARAEVLSQI